MSGMSSLKVYSGGLVGSGKLVQLNGLVSSKNWTRHTNVAMAHPCKSAFLQPELAILRQLGSAGNDNKPGSPSAAHPAVP